MKIRILFLLAVLFVCTVIPAYAQEQAVSEHSSAPSLHEKIAEVLSEIPANNSFVARIEDKAAGDIFLDVRDADSYQKNPAKDALNIPLAHLHHHLKDLPKDKKIYVISESTVNSAYAVFVLRIHGFDAWVIKSRDLPAGCAEKDTKHKH